MTGIDIPVGKALVAVEVSDENKCEGCIYLPCRHENHWVKVVTDEES